MSQNKLDALLSKLRDHEEGAFLTNFVKKYRTKRELNETDALSEDELYDQCVNHIVMSGLRVRSERVRKLNSSIYSAIEELTTLDEWAALFNISQHALNAEVKIHTKRSNNGCNISRQILPLVEFKARIMNTGIEEIPDVIADAQRHPMRNQTQ